MSPLLWRGQIVDAEQFFLCGRVPFQSLPRGLDWGELHDSVTGALDWSGVVAYPKDRSVMEGQRGGIRVSDGDWLLRDPKDGRLIQVVGAASFSRIFEIKAAPGSRGDGP